MCKRGFKKKKKTTNKQTKKPINTIPRKLICIGGKQVNQFFLYLSPSLYIRIQCESREGWSLSRSSTSGLSLADYLRGRRWLSFG